MLNKDYIILKNSNSIRQVIKGNKKIQSYNFVTFYNENKDNQTEIAFIAPKKLGNAVKRNLAKRKLRAVFRNIINNHKISSFKLVLIANINILKSKFTILENEMIYNFQKLRIING